jgi:hypothetical protein
VSFPIGEQRTEGEHKSNGGTGTRAGHLNRARGGALRRFTGHGDAILTEIGAPLTPSFAPRPNAKHRFGDALRTP